MYSFEEMIDRIKNIKKIRNITNEQLAISTGISVSTLGKILSGNTKDPQISNIIKIADALNVSADYIVYGEENDSPTNEYTNHERKVLNAYREQPDMQKSVDRLLGVERDEEPFNVTEDVKKTLDDAEAIEAMLRKRNGKSLS